MSNINLQLVPYKNINKLSIKKYHILDDTNKIKKYKICNVFAPFGRETEFLTFKNMNQHRLNICFNQNHIKDNDPIYKEFTEIILDHENYFKQFDELIDYELNSNIINRDTHGIVIRCHLKTIKNNTTTSLIQIIDKKPELVEWIQFDKNKQFNLEFNFDCLWIDDKNKKFGISIVANSVFQYIS